MYLITTAITSLFYGKLLNPEGGQPHEHHTISAQRICLSRCPHYAPEDWQSRRHPPYRNRKILHRLQVQRRLPPMARLLVLALGVHIQGPAPQMVQAGEVDYRTDRTAGGHRDDLGSTQAKRKAASKSKEFGTYTRAEAGPG